MRTVEWDYKKGQLRLIDQRLLPAELKYIYLQDYPQVANAINQMAVRGAPAIGVAAAFGLALAAQRAPERSIEAFHSYLVQASRVLMATRPTAVNLVWAVQRVMKLLDKSDLPAGQLRKMVLKEAQNIADEDVETNMRMARYGLELIKDGDTIIHHCNTGALATVDYGTALGVIRLAHEMGKRIHVLVDETRPRLQGARLTAWELNQYGISFEVICDSAAGFFLQTGQVNVVMFGGDRLAVNGDVANKIGTYMLALAARQNRVPVYCVVPSSSIDLSISSGKLIQIEERDMAEVLNLEIAGKSVFPDGVKARNPAFDITPHDLLTAIVTDKGVIWPPFDREIIKLFTKGE